MRSSYSEGSTPAGHGPFSLYDGRKCYDHDPDCGCHGPIFEYGMVGWAGGAGSGPHFFIYSGKKPAEQWAHDHTAFGEVVDRDSLRLIRKVLLLPFRNEGGMNMLAKRITFTPRLMDRFVAARFLSLNHGTDSVRVHDRHQYDSADGQAKLHAAHGAL